MPHPFWQQKFTKLKQTVPLMTLWDGVVDKQYLHWGIWHWASSPVSFHSKAGGILDNLHRVNRSYCFCSAVYIPLLKYMQGHSICFQSSTQEIIIFNSFRLPLVALQVSWVCPGCAQVVWSITTLLITEVHITSHQFHCLSFFSLALLVCSQVRCIKCC